MLEKELKYVLSFIEEIKCEMLRGKYNYNTELYLKLLRSERYISKEIERVTRKQVKNE